MQQHLGVRILRLIPTGHQLEPRGQQHDRRALRSEQIPVTRPGGRADLEGILDELVAMGECVAAVGGAYVDGGHNADVTV